MTTPNVPRTIQPWEDSVESQFDAVIDRAEDLIWANPNMQIIRTANGYGLELPKAAGEPTIGMTCLVRFDAVNG